ncbi:hypothetical protein Tco_0899077 [Tanacetum coccineum]
MIHHRIAKVDLLVYEVGLKVRVMGLFVGAGVKESDRGILARFLVMSSSTVTYTSVDTNSDPRRVFWGADEEPSDGGPP